MKQFAIANMKDLNQSTTRDPQFTMLVVSVNKNIQILWTIHTVADT